MPDNSENKWVFKNIFRDLWKAAVDDKTFLTIDLKNYSISFPVTNLSGDRLNGTLTLQIFLNACSNPGKYFHQALMEINMTTPDSQKEFFIKFLQVIYQFLQLGFKN